MKLATLIASAALLGLASTGLAVAADKGRHVAPIAPIQLQPAPLILQPADAPAPAPKKRQSKSTMPVPKKKPSKSTMPQEINMDDFGRMFKD